MQENRFVKLWILLPGIQILCWLDFWLYKKHFCLVSLQCVYHKWLPAYAETTDGLLNFHRMLTYGLVWFYPLSLLIWTFALFPVYFYWKHKAMSTEKSLLILIVGFASFSGVKFFAEFFDWFID